MRFNIQNKWLISFLLTRNFLNLSCVSNRSHSCNCAFIFCLLKLRYLGCLWCWRPRSSPFYWREHWARWLNTRGGHLIFTIYILDDLLRQTSSNWLLQWSRHILSITFAKKRFTISLSWISIKLTTATSKQKLMNIYFVVASPRIGCTMLCRSVVCRLVHDIYWAWIVS